MPRTPTRLILLLPSLGLLSACADPERPALIANDQLCRSWRHQTIKAADVLTEETAAQIEGSNHARTKWGCVFGINRAGGREK